MNNGNTSADIARFCSEPASFSFICVDIIPYLLHNSTKCSVWLLSNSTAVVGTIVGLHPYHCLDRHLMKTTSLMDFDPNLGGFWLAKSCQKSIYDGWLNHHFWWLTPFCFWLSHQLSLFCLAPQYPICSQEILLHLRWVPCNELGLWALAVVHRVKGCQRYFIIQNCI